MADQMHPMTIAELERRGPENVRATLQLPHVAGPGQGAQVRLDAGVPNPSRAQVEAWLAEKERMAEQAEATRQNWKAGLAVIGLVLTFLGLVVAIAK